MAFSKKKQKVLSSPIPRCGSKRRMCRFITSLMPPHATYVEPFCGGATIFFNNPHTPTTTVLNDVDDKLMDAFKVLQLGLDATNFKPIYSKELMTGCRSTDKATKQHYYGVIRNLYTDLRDTACCKEHDYQKYIIEVGSTFGYRPFAGVNSIYKVPGRVLVEPTQDLLDIYKQKLSTTELMCTSGIDIMKQYDDPDCLMFVDPPYENSKNLYTNADHSVIHDILEFMTHSSSRVILTFNDNQYLRDYAKQNGLRIHEYTLTPMGRHPTGIASTERIELVITNFTP